MKGSECVTPAHGFMYLVLLVSWAFTSADVFKHRHPHHDFLLHQSLTSAHLWSLCFLSLDQCWEQVQRLKKPPYKGNADDYPKWKSLHKTVVTNSPNNRLQHYVDSL